MVRDSLSEFTGAYIECALWSSDDESDEWREASLADVTRKQMQDDCKAFYIANEKHFDPDNYIGQASGGFIQQAGHDFWLTRCGHGAGFWDGDWKEPAATELTKASKAFGNIELYVGDDGFIYA
jgi:hypothetical protein